MSRDALGWFEPVVSVTDDGAVRLSMEYLGEGLAGDYNPADPGDCPLIRIEAARRGVPGDRMEWVPSINGSWLTLVPADTPRETLRKMLAELLVKMEAPIREEQDLDGFSPMLSNLSPL